MDVLEAIRTRRSIRKYRDKPVEWDKVANILDAGRLAPSAGNLQNWRFVTVLEEASRKKIADASLQQTWMESAPVFIAVLSEPEKARRYYGIRGERLYSIQNCAAAVENMLLAAHDLGLGACWVSAFDDERVGRVLNLPEHVKVYAIITLGYAAEKPEQPPKYRIEHVVWFETWGNRRRVPKFGWYSLEIAKQVNKGKKAIEKLRNKVKKG